MAITRLSGGLTPADGADPRTFPAIWNATATDLETTQADVTTLQSEMNALQRDTAGVAVAGSNSISVDFGSETPLYTRTASAGTVTVTATGYVAGVTRTIRIVGGGTAHPLSTPANWVFVGRAVGTAVPANKTVIISATAFGTAASDVVAAYAEQP